MSALFGYTSIHFQIPSALDMGSSTLPVDEYILGACRERTSGRTCAQPQ